MKQDFHYREGTADDTEAFIQLGVLSYGTYKNVLTPANWDLLNNSLTSNKTYEHLLETATAFVCECEGNIVGMAFLVASGNPTNIYPDHWSYIRMVGVHPDYAGKGIGNNLTNLCIEKARSLHEKVVALHTSEFMDAARHLYERLGFSVYKEIPERLGKRYWLYTLEL